MSGAELTEGLGLTVASEPSWDGVPRAGLTTARFTVEAEHDLLERAALFGLETARDASRGHFPGISETPLAVSSARQTATATFGPLGFRAAVVTAMALSLGSVPPTPPYEARVVSACYDRPFGFVAVHQASGLALVAGWVTDPDGWDPGVGGPRLW